MRWRNGFEIWFDFGLLLKWFVDEKKVLQIVFNSMEIINKEYKSIRGAIDGLSEQKWWWWGRFCANIQSAKWISIGRMNCTFCVFVVYIQLAHRKSYFNLLKGVLFKMWTTRLDGFVVDFRFHISLPSICFLSISNRQYQNSSAVVFRLWNQLLIWSIHNWLTATSNQIGQSFARFLYFCKHFWSA